MRWLVWIRDAQAYDKHGNASPAWGSLSDL